MPYDPNFPPANAELTSPAFREQFQGLAALIAAVPAGPQGEQGPPGNDGAQGPPFAQAVVDGVSTVNPWDPATVGVSFDGTNVHFTFGIPRGNDGSNGADGTGVSGAVIDGVTSLDPNQGATANVNFDTGGRSFISASASRVVRPGTPARRDHRGRRSAMRWWTR